jgi:antitoxin component YwqK of YwqJK toxin-antitoxin module
MMLRKLSILFLLAASTLVLQAQSKKPGNWFPSGTVGVDFNAKDAKGKRHGLWVQQWKKTGMLLYKGTYEHGAPTGIWERYDEDGSLIARMNHIQDTTIVEGTFYHADGTTVASSGRYVKKRKDGNWKTYSDRGDLLTDENFKDSLLNGPCVYYYPGGKLLKKISFIGGKPDGPYEEYFESGKKYTEGAYEKGQMTGKFTQYAEDGGVIETGVYKKGLKDGNWKFFEDGELKVMVVYKKGVEDKVTFMNGNFKDYHPSGILKADYNYVNGKRDGAFSEYYDKGKYVQVPTSPEDQKDGIVYREELQGTQVKKKGNYVQDKLDGKVIYYLENGRIEKTEIWSDGILQSTQTGGN